MAVGSGLANPQPDVAAPSPTPNGVMTVHGSYPGAVASGSMARSPTPLTTPGSAVHAEGTCHVQLAQTTECVLPVGSGAGGTARLVLIRPSLPDLTPTSSVGASSVRPATPPGRSSGRALPSSLGDAISAGNRPLRLQLVGVATSVDNIVDCIRDVRVEIDVLNCGHECLATMLHSVQGSITVAFKDMKEALDGKSDSADGRAKAAHSLAPETLSLINSIKAAFQDEEKNRILTATRSASVYNNTGRT